MSILFFILFFITAFCALQSSYYLGKHRAYEELDAYLARYNNLSEDMLKTLTELVKENHSLKDIINKNKSI